MNGKYLITTDAWFFAPDGAQYRAVWGEVTIMEDTILGIKTNRNATNWYIKVGTDNNHIIVAGCQIHYAVKCDDRPNDENIDDYTTGEGRYQQFNRPTLIYFAE